MTALFLKSDDLTIYSATNVSSPTDKSAMVKDYIGLDCRFTGDPVIVIDRGAGSGTFDTIAFVATTIVTTATIQIQGSNDPTFGSGVSTLWSTATVPITNVNSARGARVHVHQVGTFGTRYIRVIFVSTGGGFDLGRIAVGTAVTTGGISLNAERTFDDRSDIYEVNAYTAVDEQPVLLGWKCALPWSTENTFRQTWQAFFQTVGKKKCFLFIPIYSDSTTIQSDWCYGRIISSLSCVNEGYDAWMMQFQMRSIYA